MATLLAILVIGTYAFTFFNMMRKLVQQPSVRTSALTRVLTSLSASEMEEVKHYATAFGISNDMNEADAKRLLELGRKLSAHIGDEKFIEFLDVIQAQEACFEQHTEYRGEHHVINMVIKAQDLVAHTAPTFVTINRIFGGDRDGEPTISSYTAA